ncbi:MAG TPA: hypothetical protein VGP99_00875, partial [Tepidisphaeraceae bacterium]|nr:hypothetical protein [Tepidisphaeraceae bacterium]
MLVVIAIIAIMIALLLPILNRAREHARKVVCASNMRQIGVHIANYTIENRGWLPGNTSIEPVFDSWIAWKDIKDPNYRRFDPTRRVKLCGNFVNPDVMLCPSDTGRHWYYPYSYTMNFFVANRMADRNDLHPHWFNQYPYKLKELAYPSHTILIIEQADYITFNEIWLTGDH